jgi:thymidylate synthase (FAD)
MLSLIGNTVHISDLGWIELQDLMPHPLTGVTLEQAIVSAARTSTLKDSNGPQADVKLLHYLYQHRHTSPLEMCEFKFRIECEELVLRQWLRHRTASVNVFSFRYSEYRGEYYIPTQWRKQSATNKQGSAENVCIQDAQELTQDLRQATESGQRLYEKALAKGVAREQARLFLNGFATRSLFVWKIDLHNLLHFLKLRCAPEAQYEIRQYAKAIWFEFVKPLVPNLADLIQADMTIGD